MNDKSMGHRALLFVIRKTGMDNGFTRLSSYCSGQLK
jgi:hypothetical protein